MYCYRTFFAASRFHFLDEKIGAFTRSRVMYSLRLASPGKMLLLESIALARTAIDIYQHLQCLSGQGLSITNIM
jgi:hypothetical protein